VKKSQKDKLETLLTGSISTETEDFLPTEEETNALIEGLMEKLLGSKWFEEELIEISKKPITMLLPQGQKKRFMLYSPVLGMYRDVGAPIEAIVIEESNGRETLCTINNVPYLVPDEYLVNVGYN